MKGYWRIPQTLMDNHNDQIEHQQERISDYKDYLESIQVVRNLLEEERTRELTIEELIQLDTLQYKCYEYETRHYGLF